MLCGYTESPLCVGQAVFEASDLVVYYIYSAALDRSTMRLYNTVNNHFLISCRCIQDPGLASTRYKASFCFRNVRRRNKPRYLLKCFYFTILAQLNQNFRKVTERLSPVLVLTASVPEKCFKKDFSVPLCSLFFFFPFYFFFLTCSSFGGLEKILLIASC